MLWSNDVCYYIYPCTINIKKPAMPNHYGKITITYNKINNERTYLTLFLSEQKPNIPIYQNKKQNLTYPKTKKKQKTKPTPLN